MSSKITFLIAVTLLLALTIAMFYDVLFTSEATVLSKQGTDLSFQFIYWREFGFNQLKAGNLALWNPHISSGTPYFGGFQSALLYPLNLLYLIMPLPKAVNFSIVLHVFLCGLFMYLWAFHRGLHPLACLLSSVLLMFCGAHFMHIYAGHLPNLCAMIWVPLLFLAIDGFFRNRSFGWCLLGMFTITMQILAGYPQYLFYTAVCIIIYSGFCIIKANQRTKVVAGLIGMYAGATALGAVQLLTGIQATGESIRSSSLPYGFAAMFSFPPENLITLLAPAFFGNMTSITYWGRCFLWEISLFISVTGLVLAIYASIYGNKGIRRFSATMALIFLLLALGNHTPIFKILYAWIPGFDRFRGSSKFIFYASCFIAMLAGIGVDYIIRRGHIHRKAAIAVFITGLFLATGAFYIRHSVLTDTMGWWQQIMQAVYATGETYLPVETYMNIDFIREAGIFASKSLMTSAGICLLLSVLLFLTKFSNRWLYVIALLAIVEIFIFARALRATFDFASTRTPEMEKFLAENPGDYRILNFQNPYSAMSTGMQNIWGYDPSMLRRYAQFLAFTQGYEPHHTTQYVQVQFSRFNRLYKMLRCRYLFLSNEDRIDVIENKDIMPRLQLIQEWLLMSDCNRIFATMQDPEFDPRQKVILETTPDIMPVKSQPKGIARIIDSSTDHLTIEAYTKHPAILLITDAYSKGWHAKALPGSAQKRYEVMPANYIVRAIPLSEGYHHIHLEYLPLAFQIGKWISIASVIIYAGLLGCYCKRTYKIGRSIHSS